MCIYVFNINIIVYNLLPGWTQFVKRQSGEWYQFYKAWVRTGPHVKLHLLQYNNLKHNLWAELISLGRFLGVDDCVLANNTHIQCVLDNSGRDMKRKGIRFSRSPFTEDMNNTLDGYVQQIRDLVKATLNIQLNLWTTQVNHILSHGRPCSV